MDPLRISKKLIIKSPADPQSIIEVFKQRITITDNPGKVYSRTKPLTQDLFYGSIEGRNVEIGYVPAIFQLPHPLFPIIHIHVEGTSDGSSVVGTRFTTRTAVKIALAVYALITTALFTKGSAPGHEWMNLTAALTFNGLVVLILLAWADRHAKKLEEFVRNAVTSVGPTVDL